MILATLVAAGALRSLDQWSVDHVMPGLGRPPSQPSLLNSAFPVYDPALEHGHQAISAVTYGVAWIASAVPALLLVCLTGYWLYRRGRWHLAASIVLAFAIANLFELIGKEAVSRPTLINHRHSDAIPIRPFDHSFPSGHETRAAILVACLLAVRPKLWWLGITWLAAVTIMLVAGAWHAPSDVMGGFLAAVAALALSGTLLRRGGAGRLPLLPTLLPTRISGSARSSAAGRGRRAFRP